MENVPELVIYVKTMMIKAIVHNVLKVTKLKMDHVKLLRIIVLKRNSVIVFYVMKVIDY